MTVEKSHTSLLREEGKHLSYKVGEMLDLLLIGWESIFTCITTSKPCSAGSCGGALGAAGTARLCHSIPFPPKLHGKGPCSEQIPKSCWGTNHLGSPPLVWAKSREGLFYLFTITDAEFLHLCPSVGNFLVSTMANEKEVHASQRI